MFALALALFLNQASALEVLFGPEFTFGRPFEEKKGFDPFKREWSATPQLNEVTPILEKHLVLGQLPGGEFKWDTFSHKSGYGYRFISPNGWSFDLTKDPAVLEVQMKPGTVEMFATYASDMQDAIFVSAANANLFPQDYLGGGHINISFKTFKSNPRLLRNWVVDLFNHNELFIGIFGFDTKNSMSWNLKRKNDAFKEVVQRFDEGAFDSQTLEFVHELNYALNPQTEEDDFIAPWGMTKRHSKEFAICFDDVTTDGRIEIRGVRAQKSMDMWVRQIRLLRNRLVFLSKSQKRIPIAERVPLEKFDFETKQHHLNPPIDPQLAMRSFYVYVTESGEKWQDHRDYIWPRWQGEELAKFEASEWFKQQEIKKCAKGLDAD
jgi:hypothetical protein